MTLLFMGFFLRGSSFETDKIAAGNNSTCSHHDQHSMETAFLSTLRREITQICHRVLVMMGASRIVAGSYFIGLKRRATEKEAHKK